MSRKEPDAKGATEQECVTIDCIDGFEVLGYHGEGREEHSGENAPVASQDPCCELADNLPEQVLEDELAPV